MAKIDGWDKQSRHIAQRKKTHKKRTQFTLLVVTRNKSESEEKKNFVSFSPWHLTKVQKLLNFSGPTETNVLNSPIPNIRKVAPV